MQHNQNYGIRDTLINIIPLMVLFLIFLMPSSYAIKSYEEVDVGLNLTLVINNGGLTLTVDEELLLTQGLHNLTNFTFKTEVIHTKLIDNRIFLQTTECNTTKLLDDMRLLQEKINEEVKQHMDDNEKTIALKLEPITSIQGRLDAKQRDLDKLNLDFMELQNDLEISIIQKETIEKQAKSDRLMRNIFFYFCLFLIIACIILFLKSIGKLPYVD